MYFLVCLHGYVIFLLVCSPWNEDPTHKIHVLLIAGTKIVHSCLRGLYGLGEVQFSVLNFLN